jgi:hypothetical protein
MVANSRSMWILLSSLSFLLFMKPAAAQGDASIMAPVHDTIVSGQASVSGSASYEEDAMPFFAPTLVVRDVGGGGQVASISLSYDEETGDCSGTWDTTSVPDGLYVGYILIGWMNWVTWQSGEDRSTANYFGVRNNSLPSELDINLSCDTYETDAGGSINIMASITDASNGWPVGVFESPGMRRLAQPKPVRLLTLTAT